MTKRKKTDRRVIRTRKNLYNALMELLMEKNYTAVTVQEIAERANVGRATFYLHYRDKNDLLIKNLEVIFTNIAERIAPLLEETLMTGNTEANRLLFEEAKNNAQLYHMILSGNGGRVLADQFEQAVVTITLEIFRSKAAEGTDEATLQLVANGISGALLGLIKWWLVNDMPHSEEFMADIYTKLTQPGLRDLLLEGIPA